jgi:hypothetical protein
MDSLTPLQALLILAGLLLLSGLMQLVQPTLQAWLGV